MLFRRIYQFLIVFSAGLSVLLGVKEVWGLSDYVIPGLYLIFETAKKLWADYLMDVANTLSVTIMGQCLSIFLAFFVGILGRKSSFAGSMIRVMAYNIQAYPIVALSPIIFILIGNGFASRLRIASMTCYFPLLLSVIGVMSSPIKNVEHFYVATGRMRWQLEVKIRAFENLNKLTTVIAGSTTLAMAGTIVAEFIAVNSGIGYSIRIALYQSDLAEIITSLFLIGIVVSIYQGFLEMMGYKIRARWESFS